MKIIKKLMQIALSAFFFGLLATSAVLADDASSEGWKFVQENGRTYYKKGELKETYWRVIDGKYYYFDPLSGEMVVGWQYIPAPHEGVTIGSSLRQDIAFRPDWFYFGQDGVLQEFVGKQVLEATTAAMQIGWQYLGNKWYYLRSSGAMATGWYQEGSTWYYLDAENGDMKTGWQYLGNKWYYLRSSGAMATGWYQDGSTWYYLSEGNGDMKTGWFRVNGKWYYAYSSGALAVNTTVEGYSVNYNGEWVQ